MQQYRLYFAEFIVLHYQNILGGWCPPWKHFWHTAHWSALVKIGVFVCMCLHVWKPEHNRERAACNRFPAQLELICCYQRAQHIAFGISGVESTQFGKEKLPPDCSVPKLGMFNCCVQGSGWMCQSNSSRGTKPALLSPAPRLACQYYLLSFSLGEEKH